MMNEPPALSTEHVDRDLSLAPAKKAEIWKRLEDADPHARRTRDLNIRHREPPQGQYGLGRRLVLSRCPAEMQKKYQTLLRSEWVMSHDADFSLLIAGASQLLESLLNQILVEPARSIGAELCEAVQGAKNGQYTTGVLESWLEKRQWPTLATATAVLRALRHGHEKQHPQIAEFLGEQFLPEYLPGLENADLERAINRIRDPYRNKSSHGESFSEADYEQFTALLLAQRRLRLWDVHGRANRLTAEGAFPQHLEAWQRPGAEPQMEAHAEPTLDAVLANWFRLEAQESTIRVRIMPGIPETARRLRDINVSAPRRAEFQVGNTIHLAIRASAECHISLIDIGTSGRMAVLLPNAFCPGMRVRPEETRFFPDMEEPEFDITLEAPVGIERVTAIATRNELPFPLEPPPGDPFRILSPQDAQDLMRTLESLPPDDWGMAHAEFLITP